MSHDRQLVDTIKANFARKSSAQLQEIMHSDDRVRWSVEAAAAAEEVLHERLAGRAQEPDVPEEEPPPPPPSADPYSLAFLAMGLLGGLSGYLVFPVYYVNYAGVPDPDAPVPFGPGLAWLAFDTRQNEEVAAALNLRDLRAATWAEGVAAAGQSAVFITPPLADWTLAASTALFPPGRAEEYVKPLLEGLSRRFGDVQYFATHRGAQLHLWARARQGRLIRGYGWLGARNLTLWNEGEPTREERALGLYFPDDQTAAIEGRGQGHVAVPSENHVMQLACLWSIDPTTLDHQFKEPMPGFVGKLG